MDEHFETDSMGLASYLIYVKNKELVKYEEREKGRLYFYFEGSDTDKIKLNTEFLRSESKKFDNGIQDLKKLLRR